MNHPYCLVRTLSDRCMYNACPLTILHDGLMLHPSSLAQVLQSQRNTAQAQPSWCWFVKFHQSVSQSCVDREQCRAVRTEVWDKHQWYGNNGKTVLNVLTQVQNYSNIRNVFSLVYQFESSRVISQSFGSLDFCGTSSWHLKFLQKWSYHFFMELN